MERQQNSLSSEAPSFKSSLSSTPGKLLTPENIQLLTQQVFIILAFNWFIVWEDAFLVGALILPRLS